MRYFYLFLLAVCVFACTPASAPPTTVPDPTPTRETIAPTATPLVVQAVVVAAQDIPRGVQITPEMVMTVEYPADLAPRLAFAEPEAVIGRTARTDLFRENPILSNQLIAVAD